jgi:tRNA threonylcarbamoyladenosine biosynthesis protein TsaB
MILALDTSTMNGSLALAREEELLCEINFKVPRSYSNVLVPVIDELLKAYQLRLNDLNALVIGLGPGSFTALRVGLATVKGLAYSSGLPVVGIASLDALAWGVWASARLICPIIDAKKDEVYSANYRYNKDKQEIVRLSRYRVLSPRALADETGEEIVFTGDGLARYRSLLADRLGEQAQFAPKQDWLPRGRNLVGLAWPRVNSGDFDHLAALVPLYVRRSQAEVDKTQ